MAQLRSGPGAVEQGDGHLESYVVDNPDGSRTVGILNVTGREEAGERLVTSLLIADGIGVAVAAGVGLIVARRATRPLAEALTLQRRFVADASHELRTPLSVLHTRAQLLRRRLTRAGVTDPALVEMAGQLTADTWALGEVVDDLLLSAELAHRPSTFEPVDVGELAREVVESVAPYAADHGVRLSADTGAGVGAVRGARPSLRRSLAALVDNAIAHTGPGGEVTVRTRQDGGRVRTAVVDTGDGLDPAQAQQLLQRFARGQRGPDRPGRRYGLGLALVDEVVRATPRATGHRLPAGRGRHVHHRTAGRRRLTRVAASSAAAPQDCPAPPEADGEHDDPGQHGLPWQGGDQGQAAGDAEQVEPARPAPLSAVRVNAEALAMA